MEILRLFLPLLQHINALKSPPMDEEWLELPGCGGAPEHLSPHARVDAVTHGGDNTCWLNLDSGIIVQVNLPAERALVLVQQWQRRREDQRAQRDAYHHSCMQETINQILEEMEAKAKADRERWEQEHPASATEAGSWVGAAEPPEPAQP